MPAAYTDFFLDQGASFTNQLTLTDSNGTAYNLTGFTVASQARRSYYSANAELIFSATIVDANSGIIILSADASDTANLCQNPTGKLVYDVLVTETSTGLVTRVLEGQVYVSPGVTR